ncbi:hypothetical protein SAMN02745121_06393 [Nannocystis exedens]|uniref:HTTM-like domain-containing protein n=2 Tax=Nannocystis exedens TaxID=54 RepID=A0A1I2F233_9BACT|nr:hypothetical protein NAEX_02608 [Nannocystis exedens]SFE98768.1 hypothetical protein SAMN02745121_06393 [Nannocystis exedens]
MNAPSPGFENVLPGWCLLMIAGLVLALVVVYRDLVRRAWLTTEDPRALGALRVAFGLCFLLGVLEIAADATWFFSDEGMFLREGARERFAGAALAGHRQGEGFADAAAVWLYLTSGRVSPLHFWDSPFVVWAHVTALLAAIVGFTVGLRTRLCGWLGLVLFQMLLARNNTFAAGDQVYGSVIFLLCVSRCGHAYSLDNWLRCRRLRRRGELSEPGGPGGGAGADPSPSHPRGLAAIYRRIPAWPRLLIVAQLAVIYGINGLNKSGSGWWDGTAVFYAMQHHPFARFDSRPLLVALGSPTLWVMTQVVHLWEKLFPLMALGLVLGFAARAQLPPPRAGRFLWLALGLAVLAFLWSAVPFELGKEATAEAIAGARSWLLIVGSLSLVSLWFTYPRLRNGEFALRWRGRAIVVDRAFLSRTLFGRWLWLGVGLGFHASLVALMNLGGFPLATLALYIACFDGRTVAAAASRLRLSRGPVIPTEDPSLRHLRRPGGVLSGRVLGSVVALVVGGAVVLASGGPLEVWYACLVGAAGLSLFAAMRRSAANSEPTEPLWAYGPVGRVLVGGLCGLHLVAILVTALPSRPSLAAFRAEARARVAWWLAFTGTSQAWVMFTPTPPRSVGAIHTHVIDAEGREYDMRTALYLPEHLRPFEVWPDRERKIEVVMLGSRSELAVWQARAWCRRFAREHDGVTPLEVRLSRQIAPIEPIEAEVVAGGPSARFWANARPPELVAMVHCHDEPHGQLPDQVRARHGLPALDTPLKPLPKLASDDWPAVRAAKPLGWPLTEWLALLACGVGLLSWRRRSRKTEERT